MTAKSSDQIAREFEERSMRPSSAAAQRDLVSGHWIAFRDKDTPPGHVMRRYPGGRVELVKVELSIRNG